MNLTQAKILWIVKLENVHALVMSGTREGAVYQARRCLGDDPNDYTAMPLTDAGDIVFLDFTIRVST
jgi:hypothetical protein